MSEMSLLSLPTDIHFLLLTHTASSSLTSLLSLTLVHPTIHAVYQTHESLLLQTALGALIGEDLVKKALQLARDELTDESLTAKQEVRGRVWDEIWEEVRNEYGVVLGEFQQRRYIPPNPESTDTGNSIGTAESTRTLASPLADTESKPEPTQIQILRLALITSTPLISLGHFLRAHHLLSYTIHLWTTFYDSYRDPQTGLVDIPPHAYAPGSPTRPYPIDIPIPSCNPGTNNSLAGSPWLEGIYVFALEGYSKDDTNSTALHLMATISNLDASGARLCLMLLLPAMAREAFKYYYLERFDTIPSDPAGHGGFGQPVCLMARLEARGGWRAVCDVFGVPVTGELAGHKEVRETWTRWEKGARGELEGQGEGEGWDENDCFDALYAWEKGLRWKDMSELARWIEKGLGDEVLRRYLGVRARHL